MKKYVKPTMDINVIESSLNFANDINGSAGNEIKYTNEVTKSWNELF